MVIYVPAIHEQRKCWGELSGYPKELLQRNSRIIEEYKKAISEKVEAINVSIIPLRWGFKYGLKSAE